MAEARCQAARRSTSGRGVSGVICLDATIARGEVAREQVMVCWQDATDDGIIMHITPGPLLLQLAMPVAEVGL